MTGKKNYSSEKVLTRVDIEDLLWSVQLHLFCESGSLSLVLRQYESSDYKPVKLDRDEATGIAFLRIKFDNKEPFFTPWQASKADPGNVSIHDNLIPIPKTNNGWDETMKLRQETIKMRKKIIEGMIRHHRLWIGFEVKHIPHVAKFDLSGFSRELAKCSRIPDIN